MYKIYACASLPLLLESFLGALSLSPLSALSSLFVLVLASLSDSSPNKPYFLLSLVFSSLELSSNFSWLNFNNGFKSSN